MRFGSVCSGIEAASVAWHPLGWQAAWLAEIEPFPSAVLDHHYPDVPNHGDMTQLPWLISTGLVEAPELFCGGTPCQAFSVAGLRKSLDDARGNLSLTFCEIANEIDKQRASAGLDASIVFWENVPGVLNTKDNAFGCFLAGLAGEDDPLVAPGGRWTNAGCVFGPQRAVAWRVLDAQYFGVAQRRRRVFVVASAREGFDPAAVLFEFDGVRRDTAPSREAGERVAGTFKACASGGGWSNSADHAAAGYMQPVAHAPEIARCVATREGSSQDWETTTMIAHSLRGEGFDASEDGTGRGTPLVPVAFNWNAQASQLPDTSRDTSVNDGLTCSQQPAVAIFFQDDTTPKVNEYRAGCPRRDAGGEGACVMTPTMQVRRLTPVECERLQGFPDNYTQIPYRNKPAADGPRYKALGNSWAVPVVRWIGLRIADALK